MSESKKRVSGRRGAFVHISEDALTSTVAFMTTVGHQMIVKTHSDIGVQQHKTPFALSYICHDSDNINSLFAAAVLGRLTEAYRPFALCVIS